MAKENQTQTEAETLQAETLQVEAFEGKTAARAAPRFVVTITSRQARRRAGFAFGPTPVHLTDEDLDEDKIKMLKADPLLSIRPYEAAIDEAQE